MEPDSKKKSRRTKGDFDCVENEPISLLDKRIAEAVEQNKELSKQQKDFCLYYSRIRNATQAYLKAYGCSYNAAKSSGSRLLTYASIKDELRKLREIKNAALGDFCGEDVVELHMRIAFADMTDFVAFEGKDVPVMVKGEIMKLENPDDGTDITLTKAVNELRFKDSSLVDGQLISEVSVSSGGARIKLVDRQRSIQFLEKYFELNPMDKHKKEYENARLALQEKGKAEGGLLAEKNGEACVNISVGGEKL